MIKINLVIQKLKQNMIVSIPTDTIYGLSCLPNKKIINKLFILKKRTKSKGFILLTSDLAYLYHYISIKHIALLKLEYKKIKQPTTFIVPSIHHLATNNSIAVRLTNNILIKQICKKLKSAIISTSCNISGKQNIKTILKLKLFFKNRIAYTLNFNKNNINSSAIIDLLSKKKLR